MKRSILCAVACIVAVAGVANADFGHDRGIGEAEALYDVRTGELFFDVGEDVSTIGIRSDVMYHGKLDEDAIFGTPTYNSGGILVWFDAAGLPVGEDSVGLVLPIGLVQDDLTFSYVPNGGVFAFVPVTMLPSTDFNGDGNIDVVDVNLLTAVGNLAVGVAVPQADTKFDLTGDTIVDGADLDQWLVDAATINGHASPYLRGDTNLNADVDVWEFDGTGDAQVLTGNLGTMTGMVWGDGDFNGDGDVDVWEIDGSGDAQSLTSNMGATGDVGAAAVPEPSTLALLAMGTIGLLAYGWRRRRTA